MHKFKVSALVWNTRLGECSRTTATRVVWAYDEETAERVVVRQYRLMQHECVALVTEMTEA